MRADEAAIRRHLDVADFEELLRKCCSRRKDGKAQQKEGPEEGEPKEEARQGEAQTALLLDNLIPNGP